MSDMKAKGRSQKHEDKPNAKLTMDDVRQIRLLKDKVFLRFIRVKDIAKEYKVDSSTISRVLSNEIWIEEGT